MKLSDLIDKLVVIADNLPYVSLNSEVSSIEVGTNDAIIINLGYKLIFTDKESPTKD